MLSGDVVVVAVNADLTSADVAEDFYCETYRYYDCEPHIYLRFCLHRQIYRSLVPKRGTCVGRSVFLSE